MAEEATPTEAQDTGVFTKCPRCRMTVRKTELSIHLAHAHNIDADRKPGGRGGRKPRSPRGPPRDD